MWLSELKNVEPCSRRRTVPGTSRNQTGSTDVPLSLRHGGKRMMLNVPEQIEQFGNLVPEGLLQRPGEHPRTWCCGQNRQT